MVILLAAQTSTSQSTTHEPIDPSTTTNAPKSTTAADIMAVTAQGLGSVVSTVLNDGNDDGPSLTFNTTSYGVTASPERVKHRDDGYLELAAMK
ncbi:hypothetical protein CJF31_00011477 [Rutstroemia sp. NJR-2017a BVV2]|nr:hypothetical protein CJF31_00011477 [Rutstroemia sp. NJR-2017a BVV2]